MNMITRVILIMAVLSGSSASAATCVYDDLNRLTEVNYGNGQIIRYAYDATGNRITMQTEASKPTEHTVSIDCVVTMDTYRNTCKGSWFSPPDSFDESSDFRFTYGMIGDFVYVDNNNDYGKWVIPNITNGLYEIQVSYPAVPEPLTEAAYLVFTNSENPNDTTGRYDLLTPDFIRTLDQAALPPGAWHSLGTFDIGEDSTVSVRMTKMPQSPDRYVVYDAIKVIDVTFDCIVTMDTYKNTCKDSWFSPPASFDESSDFRFTYGMIGDFVYADNYNDYGKWVIPNVRKGVYEIRVSYPAVPEPLTEAAYLVYTNSANPNDTAGMYDVLTPDNIRTIDQSELFPDTWHSLGYFDITEDCTLSIRMTKLPTDDKFVVYDAVNIIRVK